MQRSKTWPSSGGGAVSSVNGQTGAVVLAAADVSAIATAAAGANNGVATLDSGGGVPLAQLGNAPAGAVSSVAGKTGVVTLVKADVGLGSVDNTADAAKPVSTLQAAADTAAIASAASAAAALYQPTSGKDATGGYAGLTLFKINFRNAANTFTSFFTNAATAARTYTFPDKDITVAGLVDITGTNSGTNTGDQTLVGLGGQATSGKDATGGYAGLTLFKINFKNAANTFTNFLTNATTAARTYTFPDKDITVAGLVDITGTNSGTNTGDVAVASAAEIRTGTDTVKTVSSKSIYDASAPVVLTPGTTVTPDFTAGLNFTLAPVQSFTLANPSAGMTPGRSGRIWITQDGTGSRVLSVGTQWVFMGGLKTLSTVAGTIDCINYFVVDATHIRCELALAYA